MINVQFSDTTKTEIIRMFGAPQDPAVYPNQGTVLDADPRYVTFITPPVVPNVTNCLQSLKVALGGIETVAAIKSFPAFM
ncbi:MAG: hypothetical protein KGI54_13690, partial [Pseudomonadota bacterium]|nr:hypothetical protein [Pseudomonadota bacterium]